MTEIQKSKTVILVCATAIIGIISIIILCFKHERLRVQNAELKAKQEIILDKIADEWIKSDFELKDHIYNLYEMIIDNVTLYEIERLQIRDNLNYFIGYSRHSVNSIYSLEEMEENDLNYIRIQSERIVKSIIENLK